MTEVYITSIRAGLITFSCIRIYYKIFNIIDVTNVTVCMNFIDLLRDVLFIILGVICLNASNVSSCFIDLDFIFGSCVMFMNTRTIFEVIRDKISWQHSMSIIKVKLEDI